MMDSSPAFSGLPIKLKQRHHYQQVEVTGDNDSNPSPDNQVQEIGEDQKNIVSHGERHKQQEQHQNQNNKISQQTSLDNIDDFENQQDLTQQKNSYRNISYDQNCNTKLNILIYSAIVLLFSLLIIHALAQSTQISFASKANSNTKQQKQVNNQIRQIEVKQKQPVQSIKDEAPKPQVPETPPQINRANSRQPMSTNPNRYSQTLNLNDLSQDEPYLSAPPDIKRIFDEMKARPSDRTNKPTQIFMPSQKAYFAYRLYQNPNREDYLRAEYYYYDMKYNISQHNTEAMLCIVAPGRNIVKESKYKRFIDSIQRQNYSNYRLVYIDDASDDNSSRILEAYVRSSKGKLSRIGDDPSEYTGSFLVNQQSYKGEQEKRRILIVANQERLYALANRNQGVRKYCPIDSVILDVDSDDAFIGNQAFKFVNAIYSNPDIWMMNSVFIYDKSSFKEVTTGPQDGVPEQLLRQNRYRTSMVWKTSELRTFKAKLFIKIDQQDFKNKEGKFYQWASDVFIQEPLVQLAGLFHYRHIYQILYFYDWNFDLSTLHKRRHYRNTAFMQTPYLPLSSLDSEPQKVKNYVIPQRIKMEYERNIIQARNQAKKYGREPPF